jgi:hypothetical protein
LYYWIYINRIPGYSEIMITWMIWEDMTTPFEKDNISKNKHKSDEMISPSKRPLKTEDDQYLSGKELKKERMVLNILNESDLK